MRTAPSVRRSHVCQFGRREPTADRSDTDITNMHIYLFEPAEPELALPVCQAAPKAAFDASVRRVPGHGRGKARPVVPEAHPRAVAIAVAPLAAGRGEAAPYVLLLGRHQDQPRLAGCREEGGNEKPPWKSTMTTGQRTRPRLAVRGGAAPDALARAVADGAAAVLATVLGGAGFCGAVVDGAVACLDGSGARGGPLVFLPFDHHRVPLPTCESARGCFCASSADDNGGLSILATVV